MAEPVAEVLQNEMPVRPGWRGELGRKVLRLDLRIAAAVIVTVVTWASAFAGIRLAVQSYEPTHVALLRYVVAAIALVVYAVLSRMPLPRPRDLPGFALLGLLGIAFYNVALNYGQVTITAGTASLLIASAPIWMAVLARVIMRERLRRWGYAGILVSFGGVAVIALGSRAGLSFDYRALAVLAAALASATYSLGQKPYLARYSALQCTAYAIWAGAALLLPFSPGLLAEIGAAPLSATAAIIYMGVFPGALGYLTWAYVLARIPAARAGSFLHLIPALAILMAWLGLGEVPTVVSLVGGCLVIAGVILVNTWGRQPRR